MNERLLLLRLLLHSDKTSHGCGEVQQGGYWLGWAFSGFGLIHRGRTISNKRQRLTDSCLFDLLFLLLFPFGLIEKFASG